MNLDDIKSVAVIGAGIMGQGISQVAALAGLSVQLHDQDEEIVRRGIHKIAGNLEKGVEKGKISAAEMESSLVAITPLIDLESITSQLVIEAVVEQLDVKVELLRKIQKLNPDVILTSNTSSIPITQIGSELEDPTKLAGFHFFNPAHIMKLVEVVSGLATDPQITKLLYNLAVKMGKSPVAVKDSPGFIVNRVARHYYIESLLILEENVSDVEEIDRLMESTGFKMGPFRLIDLIGVDTNLSVSTTVYNQFFQNGKFRPSRIQKQLVEAGHLGRKSGRGFYKYE